jgi:hypothetical protein
VCAWDEDWLEVAQEWHERGSPETEWGDLKMRQKRWAPEKWKECWLSAAEI